jgi:hypothetical protein
METNASHPPKLRNGDSVDGKIKGTENNCVLIALSDAGALNTKFWLELQPDAPGMLVVEFARKHPKGSYLVAHTYPDSPPDLLPLYWKGNAHYSALVDGVLHNASPSAGQTNKIDYVFEVLHEQDLKDRGIKLDGPPVAIPDGTFFLEIPTVVTGAER